MNVLVRQATAADALIVQEILQEAAQFADAKLGVVMWEQNELAPDRVADEVGRGMFFLAEANGEAAGVLCFQLEDPLFWPDLAQPEESAFVHRLGVRRRFAAQGVSTALLRWAADHTKEVGRKYLRLDCDASRPGLRAMYERFGFSLHSYRQVGPYYVARYEYELR